MSTRSSSRPPRGSRDRSELGPQVVVEALATTGVALFPQARWLAPIMTTGRRLPHGQDVIPANRTRVRLRVTSAGMRHAPVATAAAVFTALTATVGALFAENALHVWLWSGAALCICSAGLVLPSLRRGGKSTEGASL